MSEIIKNRTEMLFLYDIENANPNGDPLNENRPRFDPDSKTILVSDVRLKRTIRDYWFEYEGFNGKGGKDIFVRETKYTDAGNEYVADGKTRAKDFSEMKEEVIEKCIDIRVFGGVLPLTNDSITFTGPTQFQMGRSLNKTDIITEQGTGAFASGLKKQQATFRTEYKVPYALIGFNGIINEKAAAYSQMTEEDKELLFKGIWDGTKNLISRSKFGQAPVLFLSINYKEPFYIGNLRQKLQIISDVDETQIRSTKDYGLKLDELFEALLENEDKIESIDVKYDKRLKLIFKDKDFVFTNNNLNLNEI